MTLVEHFRAIGNISRKWRHNNKGWKLERHVPNEEPDVGWTIIDAKAIIKINSQHQDPITTVSYLFINFLISVEWKKNILSHLPPSLITCTPSVWQDRRWQITQRTRQSRLHQDSLLIVRCYPNKNTQETLCRVNSAISDYILYMPIYILSYRNVRLISCGNKLLASLCEFRERQDAGLEYSDRQEKDCLTRLVLTTVLYDGRSLEPLETSLTIVEAKSRALIGLLTCQRVGIHCPLKFTVLRPGNPITRSQVIYQLGSRFAFEGFVHAISSFRTPNRLLQLPVTLYQPTAVFSIKVLEIWRHNFFIQQFTIRSCLLGAGSENEFEGGDSDIHPGVTKLSSEFECDQQTTCQLKDNRDHYWFSPKVCTYNVVRLRNSYATKSHTYLY